LDLSIHNGEVDQEFNLAVTGAIAEKE